MSEYISNNYNGASIEKAKKDSKGMFAVIVKKEYGTLVGLVFDAEGVFKNEITFDGKFGGKGHGRKHGGHS